MPSDPLLPERKRQFRQPSLDPRHQPGHDQAAKERNRRAGPTRSAPTRPGSPPEVRLTTLYPMIYDSRRVLFGSHRTGDHPGSPRSGQRHRHTRIVPADAAPTRQPARQPGGQHYPLNPTGTLGVRGLGGSCCLNPARSSPGCTVSAACSTNGGAFQKPAAISERERIFSPPPGGLGPFPEEPGSPQSERRSLASLGGDTHTAHVRDAPEAEASGASLSPPISRLFSQGAGSAMSRRERRTHHPHSEAGGGVAPCPAALPAELRRHSGAMK